MVVDDQPSVCKEVMMFLKNDYLVHAFKSGSEALAYLENNKVDLILLDYDMPNLTGFEVMLAIRRNKATIDTPIVFLTGETNERMKHEMLERGAVGYLTKPIESVLLNDCVRNSLRNKGDADENHPDVTQ
jgi:PleD family two-component response regulator